jgi:hypothetical protein
VKADAELAASEQRRGGRPNKSERGGVTDDAFASSNGDAGLAAELNRNVGSVDNGAAALLQAHEHVVELHGPGSKDVRQPNAGLASPHVRPDDEAEGLIAGALLGCRECKFELRLSRRISYRMWSMGRACPTRDPSLRLRGHGQRKQGNNGRNRARKAVHQRCYSLPRQSAAKASSSQGARPLTRRVCYFVRLWWGNGAP